MTHIHTPDHQRSAKAMPRPRPGTILVDDPRATRPERALRRAMLKAGYGGLRCEAADLAGTPDVVSDAEKVVAFAHGCLWHGHEGCALGRDVRQWRAKVIENRARDRRVVGELRRAGWRVAVVWECATRHLSRDDLARKLASARLLPAGGIVEFRSLRHWTSAP